MTLTWDRHLPAWSWIFTGKWSMLVVLQIWEKDPNLESNIFRCLLKTILSP